MFKKYIELFFFRRKWRKNNHHNRTSVKRCFDISKVDVGTGTYGSLIIYDYSDSTEKLSIGNYVSISADVKFVLGGNHRIDTISSFPFDTFYGDLIDHSISKGPIRIDDDVWIGLNSTILSGVHIGQGAVIAAGAVVCRDVPPYAVVAGNPAVVKKYRFDDAVIEKLLEIDFSKVDRSCIQKNIDLLNSVATEQTIAELKGKM